jgi:hypothetical protein
MAVDIACSCDGLRNYYPIVCSLTFFFSPPFLLYRIMTLRYRMKPRPGAVFFLFLFSFYLFHRMII